MNLKYILEHLSQAETATDNQLTDRRDVLKGMGAKMLAAALPLGIGTLFTNSASAQTVATVYQSLDFALQLEYLLYNYHHIGLNVGALIPANDQPGFQRIEREQRAHINLLRLLIDTMGGTLYTPPNYTNNPRTGDPYSPDSYDFTVNGKYSIYTSYPTYLEVAQALEDMSTRVYLGLIPNLLANTNGIMQQMICFSTVEARHAAFIRNIRRDIGAPETPKPWITNNIPPSIVLQPFYLGEDATSQRGIELTQYDGNNGKLSKENVTEAFDEPMNMVTAKALMEPFFA